MGWQSDICLSFSILGVSLVLPLWICLWTLLNSMSYCLTWGKKKKERGTKKNKSKPLADFKPVHQVLLVFLDATGRGGLVFAFLPSYGFERMGTRSGPQYSQFPSLRPRSSVSCQAQISHSVSGFTAWVRPRHVVSLSHPAPGLTAQVKLGHMVLLSHSVSVAKLKSSSGRVSHCSQVPLKAASHCS